MCTDGRVNIRRIVCEIRTPPQMPASTRAISIEDNRSVSQNRLIHSSTMLQCPAWRPADGEGSEGPASKSAVLVLREEEEEEDCDRGTMSPTTPTLMDAYTPCINATCRIPSVLHSLTVYFPNNRRSDWYWDTWGGHTQINPSFFCISRSPNAI